MIKNTVSKPEPITLIGGGVVTESDLKLALSVAPHLIAADGGANRAVAMGVTPDVLIGDLDSLTDETRALIPPDRIWEISEQDSTDFEKALMSIHAPLIVAIGFGGARLDHQLAALHGLVRFADKHILMVLEDEVACHTPPHLTLSLDPDDTVSLFPLMPVTGTSAGLRWPIDNLTLAPGGRIGTSNAATGGPMSIRTTGPGLLTILPRRAFASLAEALVAVPAWTTHPPVHA